MAVAIEVASWISILAGSFFALTGGVGILRLPDLFTRLHAVGVTDTMGAGLILFGLMLQAGMSLVCVKLILILAFLLLTSPTSTHALAKAALHGELKPLLGNLHSAWKP
ncbi:MAG: monovalent cation/H(+) antiporter subunit G [Nitrospiraceae bacterium]